MWNTSSDRRNTKTVHRFVLAGFLLVGVTAGASAQEIKTWPGSSCHATGSTQDLHYGHTLVANRTSSTNSAVCPIGRTNGTQGWLQLVVTVRDRHDTQDISCVARAESHTGSAGGGWQETQSSAGTGIQTLVFGPAGANAPHYGPYSVVCSLPPMVANVPSYLASIISVEP